ncbi:MAG: hypothetical protein N3E49_03455 [Bacteroidia bacterium]|nr:hypothetical protein [Bacteroidia bacterium]
MWVILLGLWLIRLPTDKLYADRFWVPLWITSRTMLRLGLGILGVLSWESHRTASLPPAYTIVAQSTCPEVWDAVSSIAKRIFRQKGRCGLVTASSRSAFWAIPPTCDSAMFFSLLSLLNENTSESSAPISPRAALRQLRPYMQTGYIGAVLWLGRFESEEVPGRLISLCGGDPLDEESLSLPTLPLSEPMGYGLGFLLCAGLLLAGEAYFYLLRKHLPLRVQS